MQNKTVAIVKHAIWCTQAPKPWYFLWERQLRQKSWQKFEKEIQEFWTRICNVQEKILCGGYGVLNVMGDRKVSSILLDDNSVDAEYLSWLDFTCAILSIQYVIVKCWLTQQGESSYHILHCATSYLKQKSLNLVDLSNLLFVGCDWWSTFQYFVTPCEILAFQTLRDRGWQFFVLIFLIGGIFNC